VSDKFNVLVAILNQLDQKKRVTVQSLKDDFEISERSVHRYVRTLKDAQFNIEYDREKQTYTFAQGYTLSRPDISMEETLALGLSKRLLGSFGPGLENILDGIEKKLGQKQTLASKNVVFSPEELPAKVGEFLIQINKAALNFQRIEILYRALSSNDETIRKVDPYYYFFRDGFWHLRGHCHLRDEPRTFALDRILYLKILDEYFVPSNISPAEELGEAFGVIIDGEPIEVKLVVDKEAKPYILRKKWHRTQETKELKDGRLEVVFNVNGTEGIKPWIYGFLPHVEVVAPPELREELLADLKQATSIHTSAKT